MTSLHPGCKFKNSRFPRKFDLGSYDSGGLEGDEIRGLTDRLADALAPALARVAPNAYRNQVAAASAAPHCCLGKEDDQDNNNDDFGGDAEPTDASTAAGTVPSFKDQPRPFSSVTICLDFR